MDIAPAQPLHAVDAGPGPAFRKHWSGWQMVWLFPAILIAFYFMQFVAASIVVYVRFGDMIKHYVDQGRTGELAKALQTPEMMGHVFDAPSLFFIQLVSTVVLVGLTIGLCAALFGARPADLGLGRPLTWRTALIGVAAGIALLIVSSVVEEIQNLFVGQHPQVILRVFTQHHGGLAFLLDLTTVAILAPFGEELFFRGFLYTGLVQRAGFAIAAVVSGLLFGLAHADVWNALPLSVLGFGLAYVYYRTGTLWTNVIAHATINGTQLAILFMFPNLVK